MKKILIAIVLLTATPVKAGDYIKREFVSNCVSGAGDDMPYQLRVQFCNCVFNRIGSEKMMRIALEEVNPLYNRQVQEAIIKCGSAL